MWKNLSKLFILSVLVLGMGKLTAGCVNIGVGVNCGDPGPGYYGWGYGYPGYRTYAYYYPPYYYYPYYQPPAYYYYNYYPWWH